ncbi:Sterile alpha motif/pointed domain superfamily [Sesbania bispinosa]|nr:Sterile alpha motif/pointed domain superfamily [Sesbania bispinosa]
MDWFSWLSRTSLEPSLIYEYGLAFARNELQLEDASYFNHEFLQSMGISIAKHRLEILKLAKKEHESVLRTNKLSEVIKKCLRKCLNKLVSHEEGVKDMMMPTEPNWHQQGKWRRALVTKHGTEELKGEKGMYRSRTIAFSGPLDGRMHEKMVGNNNKVLKFSGPLDGKMNERMVQANRTPIVTRPLDGRFMGTEKSPRLSGPIDTRALVNNRSPRLTRPTDQWAESPMGYSPYSMMRADSEYDDYSLWPTLFEDLKPT